MHLALCSYIVACSHVASLGLYTELQLHGHVIVFAMTDLDEIFTDCPAIDANLENGTVHELGISSKLIANVMFKKKHSVGCP